MRILFLILAAAVTCAAQNSSEVSATPAVAVFKSSTNLVQVPVVVRDGKGQAVGTLRVEDFQLFDNGKPQVISKFSVEKFETTAATRTPVQNPGANTPQPANGTPEIQIPALPDRFVAYVFDDMHMSLADLKYTRDAAKKQLDALDFSHQRAAIYTTSGRQNQEFTSDLDSLHAALGKITTGQAAAEKAMQQGCPPIDYYQGDLIQNQHDPVARAIAMQDAVQKCQLQPDAAAVAVETASRAAVLNGEQSTLRTIDSVRAIVSRMAALPGQRHLVLISPGFLVFSDKQPQLTGVIERALKSNVVIGGLDARGLYTTSTDASEHDMPSPQKQLLLRTEAMILTDAVANLADGTGGIFYHGTNDYDEGLAKVATPPEYIYLLAFSPTALKPDGKSHSLKVTLVNSRGLTVKARSSYFADSHPEDPASQIRQQVQDAFFSNQESQGMPVRLQAEFFKDGDNATLTANVRVDATKLPFRKDGGRNLDNLTLVIGIFDQNGNFVSAFEKTIELRLKDETLSAWMKAGIANSTDFNVKPGKYLVRLVVRDSEGASMAQQSTGVDIPW